jgi:hypothetical protein
MITAGPTNFESGSWGLILPSLNPEQNSVFCTYRKFHTANFFLYNRKVFCAYFLVLLAGKISAIISVNFS